MANTVSFQVEGDYRGGHAFREAERDFERFQRDANGRLRDMRGRFVSEGRQAGEGFGRGVEEGGGRGMLRFSLSFSRFTDRVKEALIPIAKAAVSIAAIGSTAISAAPLLAPVVAELVSIGQAALAAAPALLALGAAFLITKLALTEIFKKGFAAREALMPLKEAFDKAGEAASKAAARGIKPLVEQFNKVNMPHVKAALVDIGDAVNKVEKGFLRWANSAQGVKSIRHILTPIGDALNGLAPHLVRVGVAFASMLGRIMGLSTAVGASGLAKLLDVIAEKLDKITKASVQGGMDKLADTFHSIMHAARVAGDWIGKLVAAYRAYTHQFKAFADAVSVLAIVFGGPVTAIIAGAGLVIRHFDQVKAAYERFKKALSSPVAKGAFTDLQKSAKEELPHIQRAFSGLWKNLQSAAGDVLPALGKAFSGIWDAIGPQLKQISHQITDELAPAFGNFIQAAAPVVAWFIDVLGPVVAESFKNILRIISGAIDIISGIFETLTAVLTGDWSKAWDGVKHIAQGIGKILGALIRQVVSLIKAVWSPIAGIIMGAARQGVSNAVTAFHALGKGVSAAIRGGIGLVKSAASAIKNGVISIFSTAGSWLMSAGRAIINGLVNGIKSAIGAVKDALAGVTNMIPSWKGPPAKDLKLLHDTGRLIMRGLVDGIEGSTADIKRTLGRVTTAIKKAFEGKHEDRLLDWVDRSNKKLQGLADKRDAIAKRIADARKYAAGVAGNMLSASGLTSIGETQNALGIRQGLENKLGQLRSFASAIGKLSHMGLNKELIRQIVDAGPEAGLKLAEQLLAADKGTFRAINQAQAQITKAATGIGNAAADALYDAGKQAGKGFLTGLQAQQKALQHEMDKLAEAFARRLRKEFHLPAPRGRGGGPRADYSGHAAGGPAHGWTRINERGEELVHLPDGSMVYPAGQSQGMVAGRPGPVEVTVRWVGPGGGPGDSFMMWLRKNIRIEGGNVQNVLGS